jgi:hypothetical protein
MKLKLIMFKNRNKIRTKKVNSKERNLIRSNPKKL